VALTTWLVLPIATIGVTWADGGPTPARCLGYGEAKRVYRGAYLHWHRGTHGRRCWGVLERKGNEKQRLKNGPQLFAQGRDETQQLKNEPLLFVPNLEWVWDERQRTKNGPPLFVEPEPWVMLARFSQVPEDGNFNSQGEFKLPVFSTFAPGTEPDVWPALETETTGPWWWGPVVAGWLAALAAWAAWLTLRPVWRVLLRTGVRRP